MAQKKKLSGEEKYENYYSEIYGNRWEAIKQAFRAQSNPVSLSDRLTEPYYMDKASILAAMQVPLENAQSILDMCAAPGGKSLVLALNMKEDAHLVSNDRSASRRNRLINVLNSSLQKDIRDRIKVTGYDSSKWSLYEKDVYDSILLDAPCSSERHVYNDKNALNIWGTGRPKQLAILQYSMLAAALDAVKTGGYILYSTCSVNPAENNGVVKKLFEKRENRVEEIPTHVEFAEKLEYGSIIMPDTSSGLGPLYFCLIRRKS